MASKFSADALEFIPAHLIEDPRQRSPAIADESVGKESHARPKHHHPRVSFDESHQSAPFNVAAPEFQPSHVKLPTSYHKNWNESHRNVSTFEAHVEVGGKISGRDEKRKGTPNEKADKKLIVKTNVQEKVQSRKLIAGNKIHEKSKKHRFETQGRNFSSSKIRGDDKGLLLEARQWSNSQATKLTGNKQGINMQGAAYNQHMGFTGKKVTEVSPSSGDSRQSSSQNENSVAVKSWSTIVQSEPVKKKTSGDHCNVEANRMQDFRNKKYVINKVIGGKGSTIAEENGKQKMLAKPGGKEKTNQESFKRESGPAAWKDRQNSARDVSGSQRTYAFYQGDLEWSRDAAIAQRDGNDNGYSKAKRYSHMQSNKKMDIFKGRSTVITDKYKFRNVSAKFSQRVKDKLFSCSVSDELEVIPVNDEENGRKSRGWYDSCQFEMSSRSGQSLHDNVQNEMRFSSTDNSKSIRQQNHNAFKGSNQMICVKCGGTENSKAFSLFAASQSLHQCYCRELQKKDGSQRYAEFSNPHETAESIQLGDMTQLFHARSDSKTGVSKSSIPVPKMSNKGSDMSNKRTNIEEKQNKLASGFSNDKNDTERYEVVARKKDRNVTTKQHITYEDDDYEDDDEDGWVTVEAKTTLRTKKQLAIETEHERAEFNERKSRENGVQTGKSGNAPVDSKGNQSRQGHEKKDVKKKKIKKKKKKEKDKPLYDNDQKKIREFKMRQMIEENLQMNLVELTKTGKGNEKETDNEEWPSIGDAKITMPKVLSFSEALKRSKPAPYVPVRTLASKIPKADTMDMSQLTEEEKIEMRRRILKEKRKQKKKERKKRNKDVNEEKLDVKNEKGPIQLDLGNMFDKLLQSSVDRKSSAKSSAKPRKTVVFSSGVISVVSGVAKKNKPSGSKAESTKGKLSANALDATQPIKMSGKERETPKRRRLTLLKKIILRAREAKRESREAQKCSSSTEGSKANHEETKLDEKEVEEQQTEASETVVNKHDAASAATPSQVTDPSNCNQGDFKDDEYEPLTILPKDVIAKLHSRKFREYCNHLLSKDIDTHVYKVLKDLQRFQTRAYNENPIKAKSKRRIVLGMREVAKHAKMGRLRAVIIAPNLEKVSIEGGIDYYLRRILSYCKQFSTITIFSMTRQALGLVLKRKAPVSAVGILNYAGVEDDFKKMCDIVEEQREKYKEKVDQIIAGQIESHSHSESHSKRDWSNGCDDGIRHRIFNPEAAPFFPHSFIP